PFILTDRIGRFHDHRGRERSLPEPPSQLTDRLRASPLLYLTVRWLYRWLSQGAWRLLRYLSPVGLVLLGPPRGTFSALEQLCERRVKGRILRRAGPAPQSPCPLRNMAQLQQETLGSWTMFWTTHRNARLVGETLAMLDDQKRVCYEAVYGPF